MLWEIVDTPHRLLGSFHALRKESVWPEWVEAGCQGITRFVFESDMRSIPTAQILTIGIDPCLEHKKLRGATTAYQRANTLLESIGSTSKLDIYLPWRAAQILAATFMPKHGFFHARGVDTILREKAERQKCDLGFLSSPTRSSELMQLACEITDFGMKLFEETITDIESGGDIKELNRLYRAWLLSDLKDLTAYLNESLGKFPSIYEASTIQRNREWVTVARLMAAKPNPTLFVMGSLVVPI